MALAELRHVGVVVNDLEMNKKFWVEGMGFELVSELLEKGNHIDTIMESEGVCVKTAKLRDRKGLIVELLKFSSPKVEKTLNTSPFTPGITHIAITVDNLDHFYTHLPAYGGFFHCKPQYSPDASVKFIYCRGPEGVIIELVEILEQH
jgi:catechol 2,3-dioxygenase-like lactoylglutathione lyase family enzyme